MVSETGSSEKGAAKKSWLADNFSAIIGVLIAIVTIVGAYVGWRAAVAADDAGGFDDAGILAALNAQETSTLSTIVSAQHQTNYLDYWTNKQLLDQMGSDGTLDNIPPDQEANVVRDVTDAADLAAASKKFFPGQYLKPDGTYDASRERAEAVAEAAQKKDLNAQAQFDQANVARNKSLALIAVLVVLGVALWLLAAAEIFANPIRYGLAFGGFLYLLIGSAAAWLIESNAAPAGVGDVISLLCYIAAALTVVGAIVALVMARGRAADGAEEEDDTPRGRFLSKAATLLIVTVALLGAIVTYLQADAGNRSDAAIRQSQLQSAEALGAETTGEAQVNFQYGGAAKSWEQMRVLATNAEEVDDARAAARYTSIQDEMGKLAELLRAPYFNPETDYAPNIAAYQADQYVAKAATLSESSIVNSGLSNAWGDKSATYIIHLTLLAAALALLGLSLTFKGIVRPIFLGVGSAMVAVTLVWVVGVYTKDVSAVPQAAIEAYGRGVGLDYKGDSKGAIAAFDEAIAKSPGYATALYARAGAHLEAGENDAAIADYESARAAGKDDANVAWELGLTYYYTGQFDKAIAAHSRALEVDPNRVWVRLDLAIAYLAQGKVDQAQAEYTKAKDQISQQVAAAKAAGTEPPPSLFYYLDAGADDLEVLVSSLSDSPRAKPGAPGKDKIADAATVEKFADEQFNALKSLSVALETTGKPPAGQLTAQISDLEFAVPDADGNLAAADTFPSETKDIQIGYSYSGMKDGQQVLWKVYVDGDEYPEYRSAAAWDKGAEGDDTHPLSDDFAYGSTYSFDPGEYTVEVYVDSQLAQRGFFTIEQPQP